MAIFHDYLTPSHIALLRDDVREAERFFQSFCGQGNCPGGPPDWVSKKIIKMHAESSGMWTINPIQDYLDMEEGMRSKNAKADMINVPGSTDGYNPSPSCVPAG